MADANNGDANTQGEDSKGQPPVIEGTPSDNKPSDAELARREQQSKKDKVTSEKDDLTEQISYLSAKEAERERDAYVSSLLSDKDKYPNVDANDKLFKYATSKEEVEEIAVEIQNKYTTLQQKALADVQERQPETLSNEQVEEQETKLEEETQKSGTSMFGNFLNLQARRKR
jgi:hypothetical protein